MSEHPLQFDAAYYARFYGDDRTRATSPEEQATQAQFIASYLNYLDVPVERLVDLGCGLGALLGELKVQYPQAACEGVEVSDYLCDRFGWHQGSVTDFQETPYDLVMCTDVLGYLDEGECQKAISNIASLTKSAAYVSVLTSEDLPICDQSRTDMRQTLRSASWYREQLAEYFVSLGGGLFLKKPLAFAVWQLERG